MWEIRARGISERFRLLFRFSGAGFDFGAHPIEERSDDIGGEAARGEKPEGFFPFAAGIGFAAEEAEFVFERASGGVGFVFGVFFECGVDDRAGKAAPPQAVADHAFAAAAFGKGAGAVAGEEFVVEKSMFPAGGYGFTDCGGGIFITAQLDSQFAFGKGADGQKTHCAFHGGDFALCHGMVSRL